MLSLCCKFVRCPKRMAIGKEWDEDVIASVCPRCERLRYSSEKRRLGLKKKLKALMFSLLVLFLGLTSWMYISRNGSIWSSDKPVISTPENTITSFLKHISNEDYSKAFKLTKHGRWKTVSSFTKVFENYKNVKIEEKPKGKSYYSQHKADTIIYVKYSVEPSDTIVKVEYDFHLKKIKGNWKIIRLFIPRNPEVDALKKEEVPNSSVDAVKSFFHFVNDTLYKKARLLTNGKYMQGEFISESWDCIDKIKKSGDMQRIEESDTMETVQARLFVLNSCNDRSMYTYEFDVRLTDCWKIVAIREK